MEDNANATPAVGDEALALKYYQESETEMNALPAEEVKHINLDTASTIATVLGVLPKLRRFRSQIAQLPGHDMAEFDAIERYAGALSQADAYYTIANNPPDDLTDAQAEGVALREVLHVDAQVQVRRKNISAKVLSDLKGAVGYKNLAADLQSLSTVYAANWEKIASTTSVKQEELKRAQQLSFHLYRGIGQREQNPALVVETADKRARAFTLLTNAYDNARRGVIYVRWNEGDADSIAPSLFAGRSNGRGKAANEQPAQPAPVNQAPANTAATNGTSGNGTNANVADAKGATPNATGVPAAHSTTPNVLEDGPFVRQR